MNILEHRPKLERYRFIAPIAASALLSVSLTACNNDPTPSHVYVVRQHQTIDDISSTICNAPKDDFGVLARRNLIRALNNLPNDTVHSGQRLNIPDSLCAQTVTEAP